MALSEKSAVFNIRQIGSINEIMENHSRTSSTSVGVLHVEAGRLEESMFQLNYNQMQFDLAAYKVYTSKMENFFSAIQHIKLDWKKKAFDTNAKVHLRREGAMS
jgi:hypothetical protein